MKGDLHVRFREKFEVKVLLLTRLRGEKKNLPYSIRCYLEYTYPYGVEIKCHLIYYKSGVSDI